MKQIIFFCSILFLTACTKYVNVNKKKYQWKSFDSSTNQSIDLSQYKSPNLRPGQDPDKLVILCATGGGSRAASFTIGTLLELEKVLNDNSAGRDSTKNVLSEVDYFSTASGGGWGASSYIAFLYQKNKYGITKLNPFLTYNSYEKILVNAIDAAYAKYQLKYFLGGIFSKNFNSISGSVMMDRLNYGYLGQGPRTIIEDSIWKQHNNSEFDKDSVKEITLDDVFTLKNSTKTPVLPMFIANATNLSNYMVVPFTPDRLHWWGVRQYMYTTKYGPRPEPVEPAGILSKEKLLEVSLAAGIKASSSVPGFIGSSTFESLKDSTEYILRLEDAGITDNFGLHTVKAILKQEEKILEKQKRIVIIIDASSSGVKSASEGKKKISRINSVLKFAAAAPDAQYPITRERIVALEKEYNCTVIYLGTETLLDPNLGLGGTVPDEISVLKKTAEDSFYTTYLHTLKDPQFYNSVSMSERALLYEYIRTYVSTWFNAKGTNAKGKYKQNISDAKGTGRIMTLAGRSVVQLKKHEIRQKFGIH